MEETRDSRRARHVLADRACDVCNETLHVPQDYCN